VSPTVHNSGAPQPAHPEPGVPRRPYANANASELTWLPPAASAPGSVRLLLFPLPLLGTAMMRWLATTVREGFQRQVMFSWVGARHWWARVGGWASGQVRDKTGGCKRQASRCRHRCRQGPGAMAHLGMPS